MAREKTRESNKQKRLSISLIEAILLMRNKKKPVILCEEGMKRSWPATEELHLLAVAWKAEEIPLLPQKSWPSHLY